MPDAVTNPHAILTVSDVQKKFGLRTILKSVSLQIKPADCIVLEGVNGAGKSTLLRILAGTLKPDHFSEITLFPNQSYNSIEYRRNIGLIGHQPLFYGDLSSMDNLMFICKLYDIPINEELIFTELTRFGLETRSEDPVRTYSRGMKQRLGLCSICLLDPLLLLMDEPFTGLDSKSQGILTGMISEMKQQQKGILITTHDRRQVDKLATSFIRLEKGILTVEDNA